MSNRRLLLLSNSKNYGGGYLDHAAQPIKDFFADKVRKILFVPYAGVTVSYDEYTNTVSQRFADFGYQIESVHKVKDPVAAVDACEAVAVGGGNTFQLLRRLQETGLLEAISNRVRAGLPYIGWSAGSNVTCPTIKTTNDMPIVEPHGFGAMNLIPFQINPHFTDAQIEGHQGETRTQRIAEFVELNPEIYVAGLREGSIFRIEGGAIKLLGDRELRVFKKDMQPREYKPGEPLEFLLA